MKPAAAALAALCLASLAAGAQPLLRLPDASPHARVDQALGLTELSVTYARPAAKGRKIWGGLVPWGEVWRAGANENTVLSSSTEFTVEGHKLPAGRYGLHLLPAENGPWQLILSNVSTGWGSYGYDPKDDAFRAPVTPEAAPAEERLLYTFDAVGEGATTLALRWEKLRIPIRITVDVNEVTVASLKAQLRGIPQFFPKGWVDAANWLVAHDTHLDLATEWADKANGLQATFGGAMLKSRLLAKKGDAAGAQAWKDKALAVATEVEVNLHGYQLLGQEKVPEAVAIFRRNAKDHPESWNVHDSLGEALEKAGDKKGAKESYARALKLVKDEVQKKRIEKVLSTL